MGYFTMGVPGLERAVTQAGFAVPFVGQWNEQLADAFDRFADKMGIVTGPDHPTVQGRPGAPDVRVGPRALRDQVIEHDRAFRAQEALATAGTNAPVPPSIPTGPTPGGRPQVGPAATPFAPTMLRNDLAGFGAPIEGEGPSKLLVVGGIVGGAALAAFLFWRLSKG